MCGSFFMNISAVEADCTLNTALGFKGWYFQKVVGLVRLGKDEYTYYLVSDSTETVVGEWIKM
jgi:hypothetical protein